MNNTNYNLYFFQVIALIPFGAPHGAPSIEPSLLFIIMLERLLHLSNVKFSILVTVLGISTVCNPLHCEKAEPPIILVLL